MIRTITICLILQNIQITRITIEMLRKQPIASSPVDYDNDKSVSDYPESRVSLQSTTQFLHNKEKGAKYGLDVLGDSSTKDSSISTKSNITRHST